MEVKRAVQAVQDKWDSKNRKGIQRPRVKMLRHPDSLTSGESQSRQMVQTEIVQLQEKMTKRGQ